jgi:hypothetical protein
VLLKQLSLNWEFRLSSTIMSINPITYWYYDRL